MLQPWIVLWLVHLETPPPGTITHQSPPATSRSPNMNHDLQSKH
jgi:hypothetical protein